MIFSKSIEAFGTAEFESVLADELDTQRRQFDFDDYGRKDWADDVKNEFVVLSFRDEGRSIEVQCSVDFDECSAAACQDMVDRQHARAFFKLTIDKRTGDGEIEPDYDARFNPEYY